MKTEFEKIKPSIHENVFIADNARVIGNVTIGRDSAVWFQAVIRGDVGEIKIGRRTNIQDGCVLHIPPGGYLSIGDDVTVGHRAVVHGCTIGDRTLIGMGAIVMDGVEVGDECLVGAGSVVTEGTKLPRRSLVVGAPARVKRELTDEEALMLVESAGHYAELAKRYRT